MIKGFKDFIMRGNVVDLAIAVVIGTAFAAVVSAFTSAIITPILNALPGASVNGFGFSLRTAALLKAKTFIDFSVIINAIIVFLLTAAVVYFIFVVPMTKLQERRARGIEPEPEAVPEATLLLREIRDALGARPVDGTAARARPRRRPPTDFGPARARREPDDDRPASVAVMRRPLGQVPVVVVAGRPVAPADLGLIGRALRQAPVDRVPSNSGGRRRGRFG